jgi:glutathione synthase/RimK-type ligase-like ATP-grasp enzyme
MHFDLATCRKQPALTPDDDLLRRALEARGAVVRAAPWDAIDPGAAPSVCLRSTWDYHRRWAEFRPWVQRFAAGQDRLWNPAPTVLWNADKIYLRELADAGVAMPATRWCEPGDRPDVEAFLRELGLPRAVLKPRVSATAHGTYALEPGRLLSEAEWAPLEASGSLLQGFVPEILEGETSLIFVDGAFTHSVHKRPAAGEFRVQRDFGGTIVPIRPDASLRAFAERVLAAVSHAWVYARVDVVRTARGPVLMELELIEPDLFFARAPEAADRLAAALIHRAASAAGAGRVARPPAAGLT